MPAAIHPLRPDEPRAESPMPEQDGAAYRAADVPRFPDELVGAYTHWVTVLWMYVRKVQGSSGWTKGRPKRFADALGTDVTNVRKALNQLEADGWIERSGDGIRCHVGRAPGPNTGVFGVKKRVPATRSARTEYASDDAETRTEYAPEQVPSTRLSEEERVPATRQRVPSTRPHLLVLSGPSKEKQQAQAPAPARPARASRVRAHEGTEDAAAAGESENEQLRLLTQRGVDPSEHVRALVEQHPAERVRLACLRFDQENAAREGRRQPLHGPGWLVRAVEQGWQPRPSKPVQPSRPAAPRPVIVAPVEVPPPRQSAGGPPVRFEDVAADIDRNARELADREAAKRAERVRSRSSAAVAPPEEPVNGEAP